ncbi:MAG TPA: protease modulator HflC [Alphaproteobacteria bacterium]|nr:protease modulator HflC [Alphaproteobacteria bacterium]
MNRFPLVLASVVVALALILFLSSIFTVHQSEQALVIQFGEPQRRVDEPGLHFKLPLIQEVVYFDKRVLDFDARSEEVPTLDQKQLVVDAFARFVIVDPLKFFQTVNNEQGIQSRLATIISSNLRRVLGEVQMSRVLTEERASLMRNIRESVNKEAAGFGVDVVDVRIRRVDLPEENSQAIFARMKTQREQEARRIRAEGGKEAQVVRAEADKQQRVIVAEARRRSEILRGEGDAESTRVYAEAFGRDIEFFDFWRSMQALSRGLPGNTTALVGSPQGAFFRYFQSSASPTDGQQDTPNAATTSPQQASDGSATVQ